MAEAALPGDLFNRAGGLNRRMADEIHHAITSPGYGYSPGIS
jgi:hypothetical protein